MYCSHCGAKAKDGDLYCSRCGSKLDVDDESDAKAVSPNGNGGASPQSGSQASSQEPSSHAAAAAAPVQGTSAAETSASAAPATPASGAPVSPAAAQASEAAPVPPASQAQASGEASQPVPPSTGYPAEPAAPEAPVQPAPLAAPPQAASVQPTPQAAPQAASQPAAQAAPQAAPEKPKSHTGRNVAITLVILILIIAACVGVYWWQGGFQTEFDGELSITANTAPSTSSSDASSSSMDLTVTVDGTNMTIKSSDYNIKGKVTSNTKENGNFLVECNNLSGTIQGDKIADNTTATLIIPATISSGNVGGSNLGIVIKNEQDNSYNCASIVLQFNSDGTIGIESADISSSTLKGMATADWLSDSFKADSSQSADLEDASTSWEKSKGDISISIENYGNEDPIDIDATISYEKNE